MNFQKPISFTDCFLNNGVQPRIGFWPNNNYFIRNMCFDYVLKARKPTFIYFVHACKCRLKNTHPNLEFKKHSSQFFNAIVI